MHIKTIVLDGFKSYGQRTEVCDFDKRFTAITGLNGSGKSNILDAICFVLGITNLSHVRAGSLQDLIYRSGQAGVNKATVSIIFDNTEPDQCPPGYESMKEITVSRQIEIGGKNKYFINGNMVPNKKLHDMFCSIQLNVNNPHFLIMQGKITKILNMKPHEILSMVEEAAGTKLYESKRQLTQKVIEKKEQKLIELNTIMNEDVLPKLEKVREEREAYLEFKRLERELEHLTSLYQAWEFITIQKSIDKVSEHVEIEERKINEIKQNIVDKEEMIKNIGEEIKGLMQKVSSENKGRIQEIEAEMKEKEKLEVKMATTLKTLKGTIAAEENKKKSLEKHLKHDKELLYKKQIDLENTKNMFEGLKQKDASDNEAFIEAQKRYEALCAGMEVDDDGESKSIQQQLTAARGELTIIDTEVKETTMQLKFCENELLEKEKSLDSMSGDLKSDTAKLKVLEKELAPLEENVRKYSTITETINSLKEQQNVNHKEHNSLKERIEKFDSRRPYAKFQYRDPETNFNRASVDGVLCRLITPKEAKFNMAIEAAAGGRLYNVVCDSDITVKKLLKNGNLKSRATFIPLSQVRSRIMDDKMLKLAVKLVGRENVYAATEVIDYAKHLQPVIDFVFGNIFICTNLHVARQIAFHEQIRKVCVTLEGDVVDPAGTLSGGAPSRGGSILAEIAEISKCEKRFKEIDEQLKEINEKINVLESKARIYITSKEQLQAKTGEVVLLQQKLKSSKHYKQQEEVTSIKNKITELKKKLESYKEEEVQLNKKIKTLNARVKNCDKDSRLKEAEKEVNVLKKKAEKSKKEWEDKEHYYESLTLEVKEIEKAIDNTNEQIKAIEDLINELLQKIKEATTEYNVIRSEVTELQKQIKDEEARISETNGEVKQQNSKKEKLQTEISECELKIKKHGNELNKLEEVLKKYNLKKLDLEKKVKNRDLIKDAENLTESQGSKIEQTIRSHMEKKNKLGRTINTKAQNLIEQEEKAFNDVIRKKKIVEQDKVQLLKVIKSMDAKKQNILKLAHEQISRDFGSILNTLLPGSDAKLVPTYAKDSLKSLEIKVALGNVWKDSLSELSGGQRSLAALSLILAMLLFKPAPLYILDEVDAALDLSHTQNIGMMIKKYFKKSQFIIVSLKDGMFSNANVLFRTKFTDGVSTITRTESRQF